MKTFTFLLLAFAILYAGGLSIAAAYIKEYIASILIAIIAILYIIILIICILV